MKKLFIAIGVSLLFLIGTGTQASAQKIHCWDLIQNYVCDAEEDINGDGKCNSRDCPKDEPGGNTTMVYCNDELIGRLVSFSTDIPSITAYVPDLGTFVFNSETSLNLYIFPPPNTVGIADYVFLYYESTDCSGIPHIRPGELGMYNYLQSLIQIFVVNATEKDGIERHYSVVPQELINVTAASRFDETGTCEPTNVSLDDAYMLVVKDLPFSYPVGALCILE
jgi:hypothetical protein